ncbi:hypothetical protein [Hyphomonas sp.]|uniref:hypothetical protein n=1 Tax=Hyphomonas sp. TaxID=87 RepID=UPI000C8A6E91|nr:hypothetical protein [Hyphomonas sp.]MAL44360.1 hypothetical protein [Hyphomonas sp.]|tara:strand:- start:188 stop:394 length:207 start_codon:yes stop_codon:yes gene_type:complete
MPRPPKIDEPTKTYNLLMTVKQYEKLSEIAEQGQLSSLGQFAVSDVIREAIDIYIEAFEEEDNEVFQE